MHITKLFPKTVLATSLFVISAWAMAHEGHHSDTSTETQTTAMPMNHAQMNHESMNHSQMNHGAMDHSQHQQKTVSAPTDHTAHQGHDHRKEHGAQIYAVTTVDNKWLVKKNGDGVLKSEIETRIGTDENKIFLKGHIDKHE